MSDFILNLVQRSAGIASSSGSQSMVSPAPRLDFGPAGNDELSEPPMHTVVVPEAPPVLDETPRRVALFPTDIHSPDFMESVIARTDAPVLTPSLVPQPQREGVGQEVPPRPSHENPVAEIAAVLHREPYASQRRTNYMPDSRTLWSPSVIKVPDPQPIEAAIESLPPVPRPKRDVETQRPKEDDKPLATDPATSTSEVSGTVAPPPELHLAQADLHIEKLAITEALQSAAPRASYAIPENLPMIRPAPTSSVPLQSLQQPVARAAAPRITHVRIGSIEVRAATHRQPESSPAPAPQGFDAYRRIRTYGSGDY
jgi:hypothetical protein